MLGQLRFLSFGLFLLSCFGTSALYAEDRTLPTPKLNQALGLQTHYQNALQGEQVIELQTSTERFIALWLEQRTSNPEGGILILHDSGQTPDWPFLLKQIRTYLPDTGWSTLAIDLPLPSRDAIGVLPVSDDNTQTQSDVTPESHATRVLDRIASGIAQLNNENLFNIAVLGFGDGAYWGSRYLAERLSEEEEEGYALILYEPSPMADELPGFISQLTSPTLDVYMNDSSYAHLQAKNRKAAAMRAKHENYLQIHDASRHGFYGSPEIDRTTRRVWGWLRTNASGFEAQLAD
jgi:hypothetical protein